MTDVTEPASASDDRTPWLSSGILCILEYVPHCEFIQLFVIWRRRLAAAAAVCTRLLSTERIHHEHDQQ